MRQVSASSLSCSFDSDVWETVSDTRLARSCASSNNPASGRAASVAMVGILEAAHSCRLADAADGGGVGGGGSDSIDGGGGGGGDVGGGLGVLSRAGATGLRLTKSLGAG